MSSRGLQALPLHHIESSQQLDFHQHTALLVVIPNRFCADVCCHLCSPRSILDAVMAGGPLAGPNTDINSIDHGISASRNHRIPRLRRGSWGYNRRRCSIAATAMSEGRAQGTIDTPPRVLGLGSAGVDFIAAVDR